MAVDRNALKAQRKRYIFVEFVHAVGLSVCRSIPTQNKADRAPSPILCVKSRAPGRSRLSWSNSSTRTFNSVSRPSAGWIDTFGNF